ncbi:MAG: hypothetical protein LBL83_13455 [Clostridiales bacterium]|nr:hypothetical protein [Clostridiales bacterium]
MKKFLGFLVAAAVAASMVCAPAFAADAVLGEPIDRETDTGKGLTFADANNSGTSAEPHNETGQGGLDPAKLAQAETITVESSCGTEQNIFFVIKTDSNGWQQKEASLAGGKAVLPIGEWIADEDLEDVEHAYFVFVGNWDADHPMDASNTTVTAQLAASAQSAPETAAASARAGSNSSALLIAGIVILLALIGLFAAMRIKRKGKR